MHARWKMWLQGRISSGTDKSSWQMEQMLCGCGGGPDLLTEVLFLCPRTLASSYCICSCCRLKYSLYAQTATRIAPPITVNRETTPMIPLMTGLWKKGFGSLLRLGRIEWYSLYTNIVCIQVHSVYKHTLYTERPCPDWEESNDTLCIQTMKVSREESLMQQLHAHPLKKGDDWSLSFPSYEWE